MNHPYAPHPSSEEPAIHPEVTHEDITRRARELWMEQGCPEGCDVEIWLEAEAELHAIKHKIYRHPSLHLTR